MNISGVLVNALPANSESVKLNLEKIPGVEVHAISEEGRMVVTIEDHDSRAMADTALHLHDVPGVISAAMIYHHYEEDHDTMLSSEQNSTTQNVSINKDLGIEEASR